MLQPRESARQRLPEDPLVPGTSGGPRGAPSRTRALRAAPAAPPGPSGEAASHACALRDGPPTPAGRHKGGRGARTWRLLIGRGAASLQQGGGAGAPPARGRQWGGRAERALLTRPRLGLSPPTLRLFKKTSAGPGSCQLEDPSAHVNTAHGAGAAVAQPRARAWGGRGRLVSHQKRETKHRAKPGRPGWEAGAWGEALTPHPRVRPRRDHDPSASERPPDGAAGPEGSWGGPGTCTRWKGVEKSCKPIARRVYTAPDTRHGQ